MLSLDDPDQAPHQPQSSESRSADLSQHWQQPTFSVHPAAALHTNDGGRPDLPAVAEQQQELRPTFPNHAPPALNTGDGVVPKMSTVAEQHLEVQASEGAVPATNPASMLPVREPITQPAGTPLESTWQDDTSPSVAANNAELLQLQSASDQQLRTITGLAHGEGQAPAAEAQAMLDNHTEHSQLHQRFSETHATRPAAHEEVPQTSFHPQAAASQQPQQRCIAHSMHLNNVMPHQACAAAASDGCTDLYTAQGTLMEGVDQPSQQPQHKSSAQQSMRLQRAEASQQRPTDAFARLHIAQRDGDEGSSQQPAGDVFNDSTLQYPDMHQRDTASSAAYSSSHPDDAPSTDRGKVSGYVIVVPCRICPYSVM